MLLTLGACSDDGGQGAAPSPSVSLPELPPEDQTELPTRSFADGPEQPTQVVYRLDTTAGSEELTVAWEGDRFALVRSDGRLLRNGPGDVTFCTPGPTPGEDVCWALEDRGEPFLQRVAADLLAVYGLANLLPDDTEELGTEQIAGRTATCVSFTPDAPAAGASPAAVDGTVFCYDEATGVGLRLEVEADDATQTLEALSFSEPDEGLFEPTAPVQPYPSEGISPQAPGQGPGGSPSP